MNEYYEDCYNGYEDGEEEADFDDSQRVDADDFDEVN